jgi:hypothetical protein
MIHPGRSRWPIDPQDGGFRNSASCGTFFRREITVELAEQGISVLLGPVGQVGDEVLDLLACSFAQGLGPAEVGGVCLDQIGVELVLADELAEAVRTLGPP